MNHSLRFRSCLYIWTTDEAIFKSIVTTPRWQVAQSPANIVTDRAHREWHTVFHPVAAPPGVVYCRSKVGASAGGVHLISWPLNDLVHCSLRDAETLMIRPCYHRACQTAAALLLTPLSPPQAPHPSRDWVWSRLVTMATVAGASQRQRNSNVRTAEGQWMERGGVWSTCRESWGVIIISGCAWCRMRMRMGGWFRRWRQPAVSSEAGHRCVCGWNKWDNPQGSVTVLLLIPLCFLSLCL